MDSLHYDNYIKNKHKYLKLLSLQQGGAECGPKDKKGRSKYCYKPKKGRCWLRYEKPNLAKGDVECECIQNDEGKYSCRKSRSGKQKKMGSDESDSSSEEESYSLESHQHLAKGCTDHDCSRTSGARCFNKKNCSCACHSKIKQVKSLLGLKYTQAVDLLNDNDWNIDSVIKSKFDTPTPKSKKQKAQTKQPKPSKSSKKTKKDISNIPLVKPKIIETSWDEEDDEDSSYSPQERWHIVKDMITTDIHNFDIVANTKDSMYGERNSGIYVYNDDGLYNLSTHPDDYGTLPEFVQVRKEDCGKSYFTDGLITHNTYVPFNTSEWSIVDYSVDEIQRIPFNYYYKIIYVHVKLQRNSDHAICHILAPVHLSVPSIGGPSEVFRNVLRGSSSTGISYEIMKYKDGKELKLYNTFDPKLGDKVFVSSEHDINQINVSPETLNKAKEIVKSYFTDHWHKLQAKKTIIYLEMVDITNNERNCEFDMATGFPPTFGTSLGMVLIPDKDVERKDPKKKQFKALSERERDDLFRRLKALVKADESGDESEEDESEEEESAEEESEEEGSAKKYKLSDEEQLSILHMDHSKLYSNKELTKGNIDCKFKLFTTVSNGSCMYDGIARALKGIQFDNIGPDHLNPVIGPVGSNLVDPDPLVNGEIPDVRELAVKHLRGIVKKTILNTPWYEYCDNLWVERISNYFIYQNNFPDATPILTDDMAKKYKKFMDAIQNYYDKLNRSFTFSVINRIADQCLEEWFIHYSDYHRILVGKQQLSAEDREKYIDLFMKNLEGLMVVIHDQIHQISGLEKRRIPDIVRMIPHERQAVIDLFKEPDQSVFNTKIRNHLVKVLYYNMARITAPWTTEISKKYKELIDFPGEGLSEVQKKIEKFATENIFPDDIEKPKDNQGRTIAIPVRPLRDVIADAEMEDDFWGHQHEARMISDYYKIDIIIVKEEGFGAQTRYTHIQYNREHPEQTTGTIFIYHTGGHYRGFGLPVNGDQSRIQYFFKMGDESECFKRIMDIIQSQ